MGALWRGMPAMAAAAGPAHGVYFAVYEAIKRELEKRVPGDTAGPLVYSLAGGFATVAADAISTPMDTVKQRQQLAGGCMQKTMRNMIRREGLGAFYASYRTTLIMNIPYTALYFTTYELSKRALSGGDVHGPAGAVAKAERVGEARQLEVATVGADGGTQRLAADTGGSAAVVGTPSEPETGNGQVLVHLVSGAAAGAVASSVTTPLDVVKTRLQTQHVGVTGGGSDGIVAYAQDVIPTMRRIAREEGKLALLRGMWPRVLYHSPSAAICWATYEAMNRWFGTELSEDF